MEDICFVISAVRCPDSHLRQLLSGISTGLSQLFYFKAIQIGDVSRVAPVDKLSVVLTIILAFILQKEPVSPKVIVGGILICAGSILMMWE